MVFALEVTNENLGEVRGVACWPQMMADKTMNYNTYLRLLYASTFCLAGTDEEYAEHSRLPVDICRMELDRLESLGIVTKDDFGDGRTVHYRLEDTAQVPPLLANELDSLGIKVYCLLEREVETSDGTFSVKDVVEECGLAYCGKNRKAVVDRIEQIPHLTHGELEIERGRFGRRRIRALNRNLKRRR